MAGWWPSQPICASWQTDRCFRSNNQRWEMCAVQSDLLQPSASTFQVKLVYQENDYQGSLKEIYILWRTLRGGSTLRLYIMIWYMIWHILLFSGFRYRTVCLQGHQCRRTSGQKLPSKHLWCQTVCCFVFHLKIHQTYMSIEKKKQ